jgi:hypothetical protein
MEKDLIEQIKKLMELYPNDMDLGLEVRKLLTDKK